MVETYEISNVVLRLQTYIKGVASAIVLPLLLYESTSMAAYNFSTKIAEQITY